MNSSANYVRAIRGPILLITIGTLLAIDHFGSYSFSRTWPVLIIAIGLMKLLERSLASRPEEPPPGTPSYGGDAPLVSRGPLSSNEPVGPNVPNVPMGRSGPLSEEGNQS
jgi:cell wall-active antibiotic response 4TMS protein YvqF